MHALPAVHDPVHKVTIVPGVWRGLHHVAPPDEDTTLVTRKKMFSEMVGLLGGHAAEELVFGDITSGASNDLERVTAWRAPWSPGLG